MPSQEELARIVREMRQQGLSRDEIVETLEDMGVPRDAILTALGGGSATSAHQQSVLPAQSSAPQPAEQAPLSPTPTEKGGKLIPVPGAPAKDVLSELMSTDSSPAPSPNPQEQPAEQPPAPSQAPPKEEFSAAVVTPPILEEETVASERLDEIHQKVDALHRAISSSGDLRDDLAEVKEMLRELKRDIHDIRSMFSAIQHLLQQILETDRSILVDLYEKSKK